MNYIRWFKDISKTDLGSVGGKGLNLGIMYNIKLPVPPGFVVTAQTYKKFITQTRIDRKILEILNDLDVEDTEKLQDVSEQIQEIILEVNVPEDIEGEIKKAYNNMNIDTDVYKLVSKETLSMIKAGRDIPFVAVRSSATLEDMPQFSFAGQQATFLNVKGANNVVRAVQQCWASLFTARAIYYRTKNNFPHDKVLIAVIVQKMINSTKAGVAFSANPSTNNLNEIVIEAGFGLGDTVVSGAINPDNYTVDKSNLKIKNKKINKQDFMFTRDEVIGRTVKKNLNNLKASEQKLTDDEIKRISSLVKKIEDHYKMPQDIEFAIEDGRIYIVQSRAITTLEKEIKEVDVKDAEVILNGLAASPGVASGKVKIVHGIEELSKVEKGNILVTRMTNPDYVPAMERAAAIVTDEGGTTAHAAIISRELGVPCIVGTEKATQTLKDDQLITVDGTSGNVYSGEVGIKHEEEKKIESYNSGEPIITATKIYMNLGEPEKIHDYKNLPFDGIGLMRIEFIITSYVKEHPLYLIENNRSQEYIDKLAEGISIVAKAINPRPVIVRFSDFKTNEYRNLKGGEKYEPKEDNPMIGWRGVSRYVSEEFKEAFRLECRAIKKVRDSRLDNVHVMLPFVRKIDSVDKCLNIMKEEGLERSHNFKILLMAEVPSIVFLAEEFAKLPIDGCSIGSNDLTQLVLGVDRDSAKLGRMGYFDERNEAVLEAIRMLVRGFKKHDKTVSICGQAPSEYPEIVEFLVKNNINSISVNPDVVVKVRRQVASVERRILLENIKDKEN